MKHLCQSISQNINEKLYPHQTVAWGVLFFPLQLGFDKVIIHKECYTLPDTFSIVVKPQLTWRRRSQNLFVLWQHKGFVPQERRYIWWLSCASLLEDSSNSSSHVISALPAALLDSTSIRHIWVRCKNLSFLVKTIFNLLITDGVKPVTFLCIYIFFYFSVTTLSLQKKHQSGTAPERESQQTWCKAHNQPAITEIVPAFWGQWQRTSYARCYLNSLHRVNAPWKSSFNVFNRGIN